MSVVLIVRIKPRAEKQIEAAAAWWSENRPAAAGAIRSDLRGHHIITFTLKGNPSIVDA